MMKSVCLLGFFLALSIDFTWGQTSGRTTRYWDCCKPACGWPGKGPANPVNTCQKDGVSLIGNNERSVCDGGPSNTCNNNQPWAISPTMSYGYAAFSNDANPRCCRCYQLDFTSGPVVGKSMIVQVTNTGSDLGSGQFDLQIPGGGVGIFTQGCPNQWGSWNGGAQYGGVSNRNECYNLPTQLQEGCFWRFDWFANADNPTMNYREVSCPRELTDRTNCFA